MEKISIYCTASAREMFNLSTCRSFIMYKFMDKNSSKTRDIYPFFTTATDTDLVENVFKSIKDIILQNILGKVGFR